MHSFHTLITQNWTNRFFAQIFSKMFTFGLRMKIKFATENKTYFKNYSYVKIGQWRGLWAAEGGLDSAQVTGVQSHSLVCLFEISIQPPHRYADPCFPKIWMQDLSNTLKAMILRGISSAAPSPECSKPQFSKVLNRELSLKCEQGFLRRSVNGKDHWTAGASGGEQTSRLTGLSSITQGCRTEKKKEYSIES